LATIAGNLAAMPRYDILEHNVIVYVTKCYKMLQHVSLCQKKKVSKKMTAAQQAVFEKAARERAQSLLEKGRHRKRKEAGSLTSGSGDSDESTDSSDEPAAKKAKKDKEKKDQAKKDKKDKKEAEKEKKKKEKEERKEKEKQERREKEKEEKKKKKKENKQEKKAAERKTEKEAKAKAAKRDAHKSSGAAAMEDAVLDQMSSLSHLRALVHLPESCRHQEIAGLLP